MGDLEQNQKEYNSTTITEPVFNWISIITCIAIIVIFVLNALLAIAIFLDRRVYEKTRSFVLLTYVFNYTLFALFVYFRHVHIFIVYDLSLSSCLLIFILSSVAEEGALYFILPICCDIIVKYFRPNKYESQSFLCVQIILTVALWAFIWIKVLLMNLAGSSYEGDPCKIFLYPISYYIYLAIAALYILTMLVFVCLLINIAVKSRENDTTKSPLIVIVIFIIVFYSIENITYFVMHKKVIERNLYIPFLIFLSRFLVVPFLWLSDTTLKRSIRKLCCGKRKDFTVPPSHELNDLMQSHKEM